MTARAFAYIKSEVNQCRRCESCLPHKPRPVLRGLESARLLIVGQAPSLKVHQTGLSFNDPSGDRLRKWLAISREDFYNENKVALIPIGLCFPGRNSQGADLPPLKGCASFWHPQLLPYLSNLKLTLLIGGYAQKFYLKGKVKSSLTETVQAYKTYLPCFLPLPHPSWRNNGWLKKNPWFDKELIPELQSLIKKITKN